MDVHLIARACALFLHYESRASGCCFAFAKRPHEMGSKKGNAKRRRKTRRPQGIEGNWLAALDDFRNWLIREAA
jgi:hypothetical protein